MSERLPDPNDWVDLFGDDLFSYALKFIPNPETARNLLQETFVAALKNRHTFGGQSKPKTWMIGILKNKIADHLRSKYREVPASQLIDHDRSIEGFFDGQSGHLTQEPRSWAFDPSLILQNKEFWSTFNDCLGRLPQKTAQAFSLREIDGMDSQNICKVLGITTTNLWVALHRARLQLRECLEKKWFQS